MRSRPLLVVLLLLVVGSHAAAQTPIDVLDVDFERRIVETAGSPAQFALPVTHAASTRSHGRWSTRGDRATWQYAVRVPTAVSLSFRASRLVLPGDATLVVRGASTSHVYRAADVSDGGFYSRILPGDTLELTLDVAVAARRDAVVAIDGVQAGFRTLGRGARNHRAFDRAYPQATTTSDAGTCVENYQCNATAANGGSARATVGIVVANLYQCTGTLLNNTSQDNEPFVLTARHCQSGQFSGGNPGNARAVTIYWNASTACGSPLGTLYDPAVVTQTGATTVWEQQDAWLLRLDVSPAVPDAYLAGFDARGGSVNGGYSVHHALGNARQYTGWFGEALRVSEPNLLGAPYTADLLRVVNAKGNVAPGASGGALFDQNDRVVGSASVALRSTDPSGYGVCPSPTPQPPSSTAAVAGFTSLAAVWTSTADPTSSTPGVTLKSILDPAGTGAAFTDGAAAFSMDFTSSSYSLATGETATLTWSAPGTTACTATGGASGDGWAGERPATGSLQLTNTQAAVTTYSLACRTPGGRRVTGALKIRWGNPTPGVRVSAPFAAWTTRPARLTWEANVSPCSINGGTVATASLASSGSIDVTQATPGLTTYRITCGRPGATAESAANIEFVSPAMSFRANGTDRLMGEPFELEWQSHADTCIPSGGAPNDGWTTTAFGRADSFATFSPRVTVPGTYTYTLTCSSGPIALTRQLTVRFSDGPAYVELSSDRTTTTYASTLDYGFRITWKSNLTHCVLETNPLFGGAIMSGNPEGTGIVAPPRPGTYSIALRCTPFGTVERAVKSAPLTLTVLPPPPPTLMLALSPESVPVGQPFTVSWQSTGARTCTGSGGLGDSIWASAQLDGSIQLVPNTPGRYTFGMSCESIDPGQPPATAERTLTVTPAVPTATLVANPANVTSGQPVTLTWSSTNAAACTASGGGASGAPWSGTLDPSGAVTQTTNTVGTFTYTVTCASGAQSAQAQATVTVSAPPPAAGGGGNGGASGGGGGGGAFDAATLALLAAWSMARRRRTPTAPTPSRSSPRPASGARRCRSRRAPALPSS
jgi:hypothetical protein